MGNKVGTIQAEILKNITLREEYERVNLAYTPTSLGMIMRVRNRSLYV